MAIGPEHLPILRRLRPVHTIVDIGANRGQFALAARYCFPRARIVSFEPLPAPAAIYRSVFATDPLATLHETAIGPQTGTTTIHVSRMDHSSSLLPIAAAQNEVFPGTDEVATATIAVGPLSAYLPADTIEPPALLKLDVQGFELPALMACADRLSRFRWIYVECSFMELYQGQALADDVVAWLRGRGFTLRGQYNIARDRNGRAVQADFLFENITP
ncbi:MAG: FkbM family methyltransferase [Gemmatimonadaceae bacterium]